MNPLRIIAVMARPSSAGATAALLTCLAACNSLPSVGPNYAGPPQDRSQAMADARASGTTAPADAFAAWQAPLPHGGTPAKLTDWWRQFDDPALLAFQEAAQRENAGIAQAAARIEQARAVAVAANAAGLRC